MTKYSILSNAIIFMICINFSFSYKVVLERIEGGTDIEKHNEDLYKNYDEEQFEEYNDEYKSLLKTLRYPETKEDRLNLERYSLLPVLPTTEEICWTQISKAVYKGFIQKIKEHIKYRINLPKNLPAENVPYLTKRQPPNYVFKIKDEMIAHVKEIEQNLVMDIASISSTYPYTYEQYILGLTTMESVLYPFFLYYVYNQKMFLMWTYEAFTIMDAKYKEKTGKSLDIIQGLNEAFAAEISQLESSDKELAKEFKAISNEITKFKDGAGYYIVGYFQYRLRYGVHEGVNDNWLEEIRRAQPIECESLQSYKLRVINTNAVPLSVRQLEIMFPAIRLYNDFKHQPKSYGCLILKLLFLCPLNVK